MVCDVFVAFRALPNPLESGQIFYPYPSVIENMDKEILPCKYYNLQSSTFDYIAQRPPLSLPPQTLIVPLTITPTVTKVVLS